MWRLLGMPKRYETKRPVAAPYTMKGREMKFSSKEFWSQSDRLGAIIEHWTNRRQWTNLPDMPGRGALFEQESVEPRTFTMKRRNFNPERRRSRDWMSAPPKSQTGFSGQWYKHWWSRWSRFYAKQCNSTVFDIPYIRRVINTGLQIIFPRLLAIHPRYIGMYIHWKRRCVCPATNQRG